MSGQLPNAYILQPYDNTLSQPAPSNIIVPPHFNGERPRESRSTFSVRPGYEDRASNRPPSVNGSTSVPEPWREDPSYTQDLYYGRHSDQSQNIPYDQPDPAQGFPLHRDIAESSSSLDPRFAHPRSDTGSADPNFNQGVQAPKPIRLDIASASKEPPTGPSRPGSSRPQTPVGSRNASERESEREPISTNDDDQTELSSLAKLRQFKASIATKRSKQLHDVDSDALAEMAASFLASANAVPASPSTETGHATPTPAQSSDAADIKPLDTIQSTLSHAPAPSTILVSGPSGAEQGRTRMRDEDLKERLAALKREASASSAVPSTPAVQSSVDRKPDINGTPADSAVKRDRLEEGEIGSEGSKRVKSDASHPPSSTSTDPQVKEEPQYTRSTNMTPISASTSDPLEPNSAGKRKRAQEWMKTTTGSQVPEDIKPDLEMTGKKLESRLGEEQVHVKRERVDKRDSKYGPRGGIGRARSRSPLQNKAYSTSSRDHANGNGGYKDPSWSRDRQASDEQYRSQLGDDRDQKLSLADRISKDRATPSRSKDANSPGPGYSNSRQRRDSRAGYNTRQDPSRRSRSPQRPAARPFDTDRNAQDRDRRISVSGPRPDGPARGQRELSPYALAHPRQEAREAYRDDRFRYPDGAPDDRGRPAYPRPSAGGYPDQSPSRPPPPNPAPALVAAPAVPLDSVAETLSLLKAQIARLEAQIPGGASASASAPAPALVTAPDTRYPPSNQVEAQTLPSAYQQDTRGYAANDRYDRDVRDRRPASPPRSRLSAPQGYDNRRPLTPIPPAPLHAHTRGLGAPPPSDRYAEPLPLQPRYSDPRSRDWESAQQSRGPPPPRGTYETPPHASAPLPAVRNGYPAPLISSNYGGYRPPPDRGPSLPPGRPFNHSYDGGRGRPDAPPPSLPPFDYRDGDRERDPRDRIDPRDPRDRYDPPPPRMPEDRPRYADRRPSPPPGYGSGGYADSGRDFDRYDAPPPAQAYDRRDEPKGVDHRAGTLGAGRGSYASAGGGRGGYEGGGSGARDRSRDRRDYDDHHRRPVEEFGGGSRGGGRGGGNKGGSGARGRGRGGRGR